MAQIGKAWVEVRADLTKFPAELKAKLTAAIKAGMQGVEFDELETKAGDAGRRAADAAAKQFTDRSKTTAKQAGAEAGKGLLTGLESIFKRERDRKGGGLFQSISNLFSGASESGLGAVAQKAGQLGNVFGQLQGLGGPVALVAQLAALATLGPIILGVAGSLVQLSGALLALPAAGGVAIGVLAPLIIAFQGVGEAVSAGLSGDVDKFAEALKGLAPAAQSVVREFVGLKPLFDSIKASVQQSFFAPLVGEVRRFGTTVLPVLQQGLSRVGGALGGVFREMLRVFSSPAALQTFNQVLQTSLAIVQRLEPSLGRLFEGLLAAVGPALPFVQKFVFFLLDGLGSLGDWLGRIAGNGQLTGWLQKAADAGQALWDVIKGLGQFILTVLAGFGDEGTGFLADFAAEVQNLIKWLQSDEGAQFLEDVGVAITAAGTAFNFLISLIPYALRFWSMLISVWRETDDVLAAIGGWFADIGSSIWSFLQDAGSAIAAFFTETIPGWFDSLTSWFSELPGRILDGLLGLGDLLRGWIADAFKALIDTALFNIGLFLGLMIGLPRLIWEGLQELPGLLRDVWDTAWAWVMDALATGWENLKAFFLGIGPWLAETGAAIGGILLGAWRSAVDGVWSLVTTGFDRVVSFFQSLPGRITALGPAMFNAAMGLGRKIGEGLANIGSFASDVGRKIVNALKSGINYVIDGINRGVAEIDEYIPGSLPRLPRFARGGIIDTPTVGLMGEAGREVILPLTDRRRTQELAEQSGLLGMLRNGDSGRPVVNLTAYLDGSGVMIPIIDMRIDGALNDQGTELAGARI